MGIANTLRDISEESTLSKAEKVSLREIAKEWEELQAENKGLKDGAFVACEESSARDEQIKCLQADLVEVNRKLDLKIVAVKGVHAQATIKDFLTVQTENGILRKALEFYAEKENYRVTGGMNFVGSDGGTFARSVINKF